MHTYDMHADIYIEFSFPWLLCRCVTADGGITATLLVAYTEKLASLLEIASIPELRDSSITV